MSLVVRRMVATFLLCFFCASAPRAATVEIFSIDPGPDLYVWNSLGVDLGAINLLVSGATGFTPNPANLGISLPDTTYVSRPIPGYAWDSLVISNLRNGVSIADAGEWTLLGSFQGIQRVDFGLLPGEVEFPEVGVVFGATLFDVNLQPIVASRIEFTDTCWTFCLGNSLLITVPEPSAWSLTLAALAIAAIVRARP